MPSAFLQLLTALQGETAGRARLDRLRALLDRHRPLIDEGTVARPTCPVEADVTKPPLLAWATWKLYEIVGDRKVLDEMYEPLVRWNNWWFEKNDLDRNGLCEYQHPFSSGLDASPQWDQGRPVEAPDLNTYLGLQREALARIAAVLGETAQAEKWAERAAASAQRMIRLAGAGARTAPHAGDDDARRRHLRVLPPGDRQVVA